MARRPRRREGKTGFGVPVDTEEKDHLKERGMGKSHGYYRWTGELSKVRLIGDNGRKNRGYRPFSILSSPLHQVIYNHQM